MSNLSKLGPMWVGELIHKVQFTRNRTAESLALLKPDGDYAKQHQMVLDVADRMLAAASAPRDEIAQLTAENAALRTDLAEARKHVTAMTDGAAIEAQVQREMVAALQALDAVGALTESIGGGDEVEAAQKLACIALAAAGAQ